jgi:hypothetical protein
MALSTHRLDLVTRIEEIDERLSVIDTEQERLRSQLQSTFDDSDVEDPEELARWSDFEEEWDRWEVEKTELTGERLKFMETVVLWNNDMDGDTLREDSEDYHEAVEERYGEEDECVIVVRELTFGQLQRVSDDMMEQSFDVDVQNEDIQGTPRQGFYQTELLNEAIEDWPPGAPCRQQYSDEIPDAGDYPIPVGEWLFELVDAINTTGESEMGNSSLKDAMNFN